MSNIKKMVSLFIFVVITTLFYTGVYAQNVPDIKIPGVVIKSIIFNKELDLFEVIAENNVLFYLTKDSKHVIFGNIIDIKTMKNITDERKREIFKVNFKSLPLGDALKLKDGKKKVAVFTSPFCPWCRKLHEELDKTNDYSVYAFVIPYGNSDVLKTMLCMNNTKDVFSKAYKGEGMPDVGNTSCEKANVLQKNADLMRKHGITGLPSIILENGKIINGYVKLEKIKEELSR